VSRLGQHECEGPPRRNGRAQKNGPPAIGKSRGGWTTKIYLVAADDRIALTFSRSPGQAHDAPEGRKLLADWHRRFRRIFPRFEKLDLMFTAFFHFALITDMLCVNTP
jgi:hypothetical protein